MRKVRPKGPLHPQRNWSASVLSAMKSLLWHSSLSFYLLSQIWAPLLKVVRSRPWEECRKSAVSLKLEPLLTRRALRLSSWLWPALHHGAAVLWPLSEPLLPRESWGGAWAAGTATCGRATPLLLAGGKMCQQEACWAGAASLLPWPQPSFFLSFHPPSP